jgi:hypothetical protein
MDAVILVYDGGPDNSAQPSPRDRVADLPRRRTQMYRPAVRTSAHPPKLSGENLAKLTEKGEPAAVIDTGEWSAPPGVTEDQILSRSWALRNDQRHVVPRKVL